MRAEPVRAVPHGVHAGDVGQQHLRRADVAGRLLPADVLLTGLEGEAQRGASGGVGAHPDQAPGQRPGVGVAGGQERRVRAAEPHGHAEALGRPDDDVGAVATGRSQQHQGEEVAGDDREAAPVMHRVDRRLQVGDGARRAGVGEEGAEAALDVLDPADVQRDAHRLGPGLQYSDRLRMGVGVDDEGVARGPRQPAGHRHGLCRSGALVEHGGVGQVEPGEVGDHGLEVEDRLQPALADLRLVGRVGRVPGGVLEEVALDDGRGDRAVVPHADQRGEHLVAPGQRPEIGQHLPFAAAGRRSSGWRWRMRSGTARSISSSSAGHADGGQQAASSSGQGRCGGERTPRGPAARSAWRRYDILGLLRSSGWSVPPLSAAPEASPAGPSRAFPVGEAAGRRFPASPHPIGPLA